jgi:pSer/pThr/pTyr-binding forkhead associated (FHA) protein
MHSSPAGLRTQETRCITLGERQAALRRLPAWEQVRAAWQRSVALPPGRPALAVLVVGPEDARARVVDTSGADGGALLAAVTVGRHAGTDLWLDAAIASRRHLAVVAHGTAVAAIDLRSPLGTIGALRPPGPGEPVVLVVGDAVVVAAVAAPGRALPALPPAPALPDVGLVVRPTPRVSALVHRGVQQIELPFDDGLLIGRGERCDVIVIDENVSRLHAALLRLGDAAVIVDLGSTNGTQVRRAGGGTVSLGPAWRACALLPGDVLGIGDCSLVLHDLRAAATPPTADAHPAGP